MGVTVTTGKKVAAIPRANAEPIYVLFEETYEKNVYPHSPNWDARGIGPFNDVMLRVFQGAASCEGGMLQVRAGQTTPEAYIDSWRRAFKAPVLMPDQEIELVLGGKSMYSPIPDERVGDAIEALKKIGRDDLVTDLQAGSVNVRLHSDVDVIVALYGVHTSLSLWKVLRGGPPLSHNNFDDSSMAPATLAGTIVAPAVHAFRVDSENVVVSIAGEAYQHLGWDYAAMGHFIREVALPMELKCEGAAKKLIAAFRAKLDNAPALPDSSIITITPLADEHSYYVGNAKKLAVELGKALSIDTVPETFQVTFKEILEAGEQHRLSMLQVSQTRWEVPQAVLDGPALPTATPQLYFAQDALF